MQQVVEIDMAGSSAGTLLGKGKCFIPTRRDVCLLDVRDDSRLGYVVLACMLDCLGKDLLSHQAKRHAVDFEARCNMDETQRGLRTIFQSGMT